MFVRHSSVRVVPALVLLAVMALAGCDTGVDAASEPERFAASTDSTYAQLLADVGGVDGLSTLFRESTDAELVDLFARYGMASEIVEVADADEAARIQDITACPQRFPSADQTKWFLLRGAGGVENHYIDSRGRPLTAFKLLGPIVTASRQTSCQTNVGNWASPASSYDGGHLIGSQLGGWGGRANLVPQHYNFNRGNWKRIEDALADCGRLGSGAVEYHVDVDYPDTSTLTPSQFHADVKIAGAWKSADFSNTSGGGSSGTSRATSLVSWLRDRGCY